MEIQVLEASYGLTVDPHAAGNRTPKVRALCEGTQRCEFEVDQRNFGDPFAGHAKDFRVTWRCGSNPGNKVIAYPPIKEGQGRSVLLTCP